MLNWEERMYHHSKPHKSAPVKLISQLKKDHSSTTVMLTHHNKSHSHKGFRLSLVLVNKRKNLKLTDGELLRISWIVSKKKINNSKLTWLLFDYWELKMIDETNKWYFIAIYNFLKILLNFVFNKIR